MSLSEDRGVESGPAHHKELGGKYKNRSDGSTCGEGMGRHGVELLSDKPCHGTILWSERVWCVSLHAHPHA